MAIDTSIYQNALRPPKTVQEYDQEASAAQQNKLSLMMSQQKMDEYTRGVAGENALSKLLAGGAAPQDVATGLASQGYGKAAMAYTKQQQDAAKTAAETSHLTGQTGKLTSETKGLDYDLERKKHDRALTEITSFNSPADAMASLDAHVKSGELPPEQAEVMRKAIPTDPSDPKAFRKWQLETVQGLLTAKDRMEYIAPTANTLANNATSVQTTQMTNATSRANNASTNATTQRGQNMTDARTRESTAVTAAAGKVPAGYRANADGSMSYIPGGPADPTAAGGKAPTEFQGKSAAFGARAEESDRILSALENDGVKNTGVIRSAVVGAGEMVPFMGDKVGAALGSGMNSLPGILGGPSGKQQQVEQARRDFVNAVLRQESGAAIGASEFENAARQYFPQPGDTAEVITQKSRNRKLAIKGFQNSAGKAAFSATPEAPADDIHAQAAAILGRK